MRSDFCCKEHKYCTPSQDDEQGGSSADERGEANDGPRCRRAAHLRCLLHVGTREFWGAVSAVKH